MYMRHVCIQFIVCKFADNKQLYTQNARMN